MEVGQLTTCVAYRLQPGTRAQRSAGLEAQPSASMPLQQPESARGESQIPTFAPYRPQVLAQGSGLALDLSLGIHTRTPNNDRVLCRICLAKLLHFGRIDVHVM